VVPLINTGETKFSKTGETMKDYSFFYTPKELSRLLIDECGIRIPNNIIDICAGSWNLLNAAHEKWPDAKITGVDIDKRSDKSIIQDGRAYTNEMLIRGQFFDLVVANPPFSYEKPGSKLIEMIYRNVQDNFQFNGYILSRLESTMMLFNSFLVKNEGVLASIVPTSMINSETQEKLRIYLSRHFSIVKIIMLPSNAFNGRDINTSIIILKKQLQKKPTKVYEGVYLNEKYTTHLLGEISTVTVKKGIWNLMKNQKKTKKRFNYNIVRNKISSSEMKGNQIGHHVIHSSSISDEGYVDCDKLGKIRKLPGTYYLTNNGDVVIVRVGRNAGRCALITDGQSNILTSDCVFLIKTDGVETGKYLVEKLSIVNFSLIKKGVAARYITMSDIDKLISDLVLISKDNNFQLATSGGVSFG
jgi:hypothetical protein